MRALRSALLSNPWTLASIMSGYLWGFALLAPGDTTARPTYRHLAEVASEEVWTAVFLTVATLQLWRMVCRSNRKTFPYEFCLKLIAAILWAFVGVACMISQWPLAAAMADTMVVALFSWIDLVRVRPCHGCPIGGTCPPGDCFYGRS
jgi:hypothetical protein